MPGSSPELSIIIPAYNESGNIRPLVRELMYVLEDTGKTFEVLFIDDGSSDDTVEQIELYRKEYPQIRLIRFESNKGQTAAMAAGFKHALGAVLITCDADRQNNPRDIPRMLEGLSQYDMVCGWRKVRWDSISKKISSRIANAVRNTLTSESIKDTGCTLKVFKRACVQNLKLYNGFHRFLPTLIKMEGFTVGEIEVSHRPRLSGKSKYGIGNRMFKGLADLFVVRWMIKHHIKSQPVSK
ncbi:glycosyltransferase family 2 protein [bacterium]|nr:glycosyltransferase family 2 protein [bacterium]MCP5463083.1 glycosyltransferase family 2 protein [bacterium]